MSHKMLQQCKSKLVFSHLPLKPDPLLVLFEPNNDSVI